MEELLDLRRALLAAQSGAGETPHNCEDSCKRLMDSEKREDLWKFRFVLSLLNRFGLAAGSVPLPYRCNGVFILPNG